MLWILLHKNIYCGYSLEHMLWVLIRIASVMRLWVLIRIASVRRF